MDRPEDWLNPIIGLPGTIQERVDPNMAKPREISEILTEILTTGLLRIRALGWSGEAERCAIESDHIHNVPDLLTHYSPERLGYYWNLERTSYISQTPVSELAVWEPLWRQLQEHIEVSAFTNSVRETGNRL
jgi:hypothetical protein